MCCVTICWVNCIYYFHVFTGMIADKVCSCLLRLPKSLPLAFETSKYNFTWFSPDPDWIEQEGEEAAINRELEIILCLQAYGLVLPEHGPGIVALANILHNLINAFPNSVLSMIWLEDVMRAAKAAIAAARVQVCYIIQMQLFSTWHPQQAAAATHWCPHWEPWGWSCSKPRGNAARGHKAKEFSQGQSKGWRGK